MDLLRKYREGSLASAALLRDDLIKLFGGRRLDTRGLESLNGVTTIDSPAPNRVVFLERFSHDFAEQLAAIKCRSMLFVLTPEYDALTNQPRLVSDAPRTDYAAIVARLFDYDGTYWHQTTPIHPSAVIGKSAQILPGVVIGRNCSIGADCLIHPNVVIGPNCRIGANCVIRSGAVIGQPGFGIFRDGAGQLKHFPHVAGVVVERCVEIGALTTISAGSIHPTVVGEFAKIDDHVQIGHNCVIGRRVQLIGSAVISGSVSVGDDCWIGPNASVIDAIQIGKGSHIAIGSNVLKSLPEGIVAFGNPAREVGKAGGS